MPKLETIPCEAITDGKQCQSPATHRVLDEDGLDGGTFCRKHADDALADEIDAAEDRADLSRAREWKDKYRARLRERKKDMGPSLCKEMMRGDIDVDLDLDPATAADEDITIVSRGKIGAPA